MATLELTEIEAGKPDTTELETQGDLIVTQAREMIIDSAETWTAGAEFLRLVKTRQDRVGEVYDPIVKRWHQGHKDTLAEKAGHLVPFNEAGAVVRKKMTDYKAEERRQREAEEARLRAEAQKQAEEERLAEAERLEAEGRKAQADAVLEAPIVAAPVVLPTQAPKTEGVSTRQVWKFRITDAAMIPRQWLIPDEKAIGAVVRAQGAGAIGTIPGVEVYSEDSVAVKGYQ